MPEREKLWSKHGDISCTALMINGVEVDPSGLGGAKIPAITPLRKDSTTETIVSRFNEMIAALKAAGIMENK